MADNRHILVIHGPNLNMLGQREPDIYGHETLAQIDQSLQESASDAGVTLTCFQSNHEGEIVDVLQQHMGKAAGVIINPGAYTHTSIAIRDALSLFSCPILEVHLSNIYKREAFRSQSLVSPVATAVISGLGASGYRLALAYLLEKR